MRGIADSFHAARLPLSDSSCISVIRPKPSQRQRQRLFSRSDTAPADDIGHWTPDMACLPPRPAAPSVTGRERTRAKASQSKAVAALTVGPEIYYPAPSYAQTELFPPLYQLVKLYRLAQQQPFSNPRRPRGFYDFFSSLSAFVNLAWPLPLFTDISIDQRTYPPVPRFASVSLRSFRLSTAESATSRTVQQPRVTTSLQYHLSKLAAVHHHEPSPTSGHTHQ